MSNEQVPGKADLEHNFSHDGKVLAKLLKMVTNELEKMSTSDISSVLSGKSSVEIRIRKKSERLTKVPKAVGNPAVSFSDIRHQLESCETREDGLRIIRNKIRVRQELELFAKYLDLPAQKKDNTAKLEERIIEATIGFRLTSLTFKEYQR